MISNGNWQTLAQGTSPSGYYGWTTSLNVDFPCDYALIKIAIPSNPDWIRAGWFRQVTIGVEPYVLIRRQLNQEGRLIRLEPIDNCVFHFTALSYIKDFTYSIRVRYI